MKRDNIGVALIGFGYWGPNYARILHSVSNVSLKWIVDLDEKLLQSARKIYPDVSVTKNYLDILNNQKIDAIIIATPTTTHSKIVTDALKVNKHVLVEKPLATSTKEAKKLSNLAKSKRLVLLVGHTYLYNPAIDYLKNEIANGELGNILFFSAQRTNLGPIRSDVNAMWDLAPHDISTILYLSDAKPISVTASGLGFINKKLEDVVNIDIKFDDDSFATILVSWLAPSKIRNLTIVGDKKMAVFDDVSIDEKLKIINKTVTQMKKGQTIPFAEFKQLSLRHGGVHIPSIPEQEPLRVEVINFINSVLKHEKPHVSLDHATEVVKTLETAQKSIERRRTVYCD